MATTPSPHIGPFKHINNGDTITRFAIRDNPNPLDPTAVTLAYGSLELPKLRSQLAAEELVVRQRAVVSLCNILHKQSSIVTAIECDIITALVALLQDRASLSREKAALALSLMARSAVGRTALAESAVLGEVAARFDESEDFAVRVQAHTCLLNQSLTPEGAKTVVGAGLIPLLVKKAAEEEMEIKVIVLATLVNCVRQDASEALAEGAVSVTTELLRLTSEDMGPTCEEVRELSAKCLMYLTFPFEGKEIACKTGSVAVLVSLLDDSSREVRAAVCGALMTVCVSNEGKALALDAGAVALLTGLLDDEDGLVKLNTIKVITVVAEHPQGRRDFAPVVEKLAKIASSFNGKDELMVRSANTAANVITWKP